MQPIRRTLKPATTRGRGLERCIASVLLLASLSGAGVAQESNELSDSVQARVKKGIEHYTSGSVAVDTVSKTPIAGLYEISSGTDVFYADASGRYALVEGRLMDLQDKQDLTAIRLDRLSRIDFRTLPLDLAIKTVSGDGRRVLAIFEDPTCPVCRALHKFIAQLPDVTVYAFAYPVVSPEAAPIARSAWCAPDRASAWDTAMRGTPLRPATPCDTRAIEQIVALGDRLHITGTPTVFLADGRRLVGAVPPDQFVRALDELAPPRSEPYRQPRGSRP